jgi:PAT family beta-lactamase induction signal transducer AmpG
MSPPVLWLAWMLLQHGWVMPVPAGERAARAVPAVLVTALWVATLAYAVAQGLMYGTRSAIFMDVTNPRVAATQFTAYMAMMNLAISYSATWQGIAVEAFGYPKTLLIDALTGLLCLLFLAALRPSATPEGDGDAPARARTLAAVLAVGCLTFGAWRLAGWDAGAARPILETLFTLVFVASAVFLAAGGAALGTRLGRVGIALAPLLLALHARHWVPQAEAAYVVVALAAAALLAAQARLGWETLRPSQS